MNNNDPFAFFITWTVYGTFLQGDVRGWRRRRKGEQKPQPLLADWRRDQLLHPIVLLDTDDRDAVNRESQRLADFRGWKLWFANARSNHVHVVVSVSGMAGDKVRDQLKANCTRVLRERREAFRDRSVWTKLGDWECINTDNDMEDAIEYAGEAQERMELKYLPPNIGPTTVRQRVSANRVCPPVILNFASTKILGLASYRWKDGKLLTPRGVSL